MPILSLRSYVQRYDDGCYSPVKRELAVLVEESGDLPHYTDVFVLHRQLVRVVFPGLGLLMTEDDPLAPRPKWVDSCRVRGAAIVALLSDFLRENHLTLEIALNLKLFGLFANSLRVGLLFAWAPPRILAALTAGFTPVEVEEELTRELRSVHVSPGSVEDFADDLKRIKEWIAAIAQRIEG